MKINKEGYIIISVTGLACVAMWIAAFFFIKPMVGIYLWIFGALLFIFWLFVMAFFRQPRRVQIHDDELIFSPCDGRAPSIYLYVGYECTHELVARGWRG